MDFQFESLAAFISMKGHGPFVWSVYGISIMAFIYLIYAPIKAYKDMVKIELKKLSRDENASN